MNNTYLKIFIGFVLFGTLVLLTYYPPAHAERLVDLIFTALLGLGITHLGSGQSSSSPTSSAPVSTDKQAGFARLSLLVVMAAVSIVLTGCAVWQQAVQTYGAVAVTNARAANDTIIEAQKVTLCGLPFSAIQRHPEMVPVVRALCVAPGDKTTNELLDALEAKRVAKQ